MEQLFSKKVQAIVDERGWDRDSVLDHIDSFFTERGLQEEFASFLRLKATEEEELEAELDVAGDAEEDEDDPS